VKSEAYCEAIDLDRVEWEAHQVLELYLLLSQLAMMGIQ
jgi:hypothetical protein